MSLDQLMAFAVNPRSSAQEQVWQVVQRWIEEPYYIRRMLTEGTVRASDRRAHFVENRGL